MQKVLCEGQGNGIKIQFMQYKNQYVHGMSP